MPKLINLTSVDGKQPYNDLKIGFIEVNHQDSNAQRHYQISMNNKTKTEFLAEGDIVLTDYVCNVVGSGQFIADFIITDTTVYCIDDNNDLYRYNMTGSHEVWEKQDRHTQEYKSHLLTLHRATIKDKKINSLVSPLLRQYFQSYLLGTDNVLSWNDVRELNELTLKLQLHQQRDDLPLCKFTIERLNKKMMQFADKLQLSNDQKKNITFEMTNDDTIVSSTQAITHECELYYQSSRLFNFALRDHFRKLNVTLSAEQVDKLNQFFFTYNEINVGDLKLEKVNDTLKTLELPQLDANDENQQKLELGVRIYSIISEIKNPTTMTMVLMYSDALKRTDYGHLDDDSIQKGIETLNGMCLENGGDLTEEDLNSVIPMIVDDPNGTPALFTKSEWLGNEDKLFDLIKLDQRQLNMIETKIQPIFPELADRLEQFITSMHLNHEYAFNQHGKAKNLFINRDGDTVSQVMNDIQHDIRQGASMYEALNLQRLSQLICLKPLENVQADEVEKLKRYQTTALEKFQQSFANDQDRSMDNKIILSDVEGNIFQLKATTDERTGDIKLVVITRPSDVQSPIQQALNLCQMERHSGEMLQQVEVPQILSKQALWYQGNDDQSWSQWHWCPRTQCLGRINADGEKLAYSFSTPSADEGPRWVPAPAEKLAAMSWPSRKVIFPVNYPATHPNRQYGTADKSLVFEDKEGMITFFREIHSEFERQLKESQPDYLYEKLDSLKALSPSEDDAYIPQSTFDDILDAVGLLNVLEKQIVAAQTEIIKNQDKMVATLAESIKKASAFTCAQAAQKQCQDIYHNHRGALVGYSKMLRKIDKLRTRYENVLKNSKVGVQLKQGSNEETTVDVKFGGGENENEFVETSLSKVAEPQVHEIETSNGNKINITTDQQKTIARIPEDTTEADSVRVFQRCAEMSHGKQLPIRINFNEKSPKAKQIAETLMKQALVYLAEAGKDPEAYLYINGKRIIGPKSKSAVENLKADLDIVRKRLKEQDPIGHKRRQFSLAVNEIKSVAMKHHGKKPENPPEDENSLENRTTPSPA